MAKDNRFELWYRVFYDIFFNTSWYALNMLKINIKKMLFCLENINIKHIPNVIDMCGKCSLSQSALYVKHSAVVITSDTGLMHIAAAYKKNIITIWGNTTPQLGMYPYMPNGKGKYINKV